MISVISNSEDVQFPEAPLKVVHCEIANGGPRRSENLMSSKTSSDATGETKLVSSRLTHSVPVFETFTDDDGTGTAKSREVSQNEVYTYFQDRHRPHLADILLAPQSTS